MISVNLFAQPGSGKSTTAAFVFAYLKNRGCNVELVSEFAKQLTYQKRQHEMSNQVYLLAKQYKKMKDIESYGKVPMIITDSPILIGLMYARDLDYYYQLSELTLKLHGQFTNVNVLVNRTKPYNPSGRNQTEEESNALAEKVLELPVSFDYRINGDENGQKAFAKKMLALYKLVDKKAKKV